MTWPMLREMRDGGMVVGGHTVTHPILAQLLPERQSEEISGCGRRLAEELGEPMRYFSYPVGKRNTFNSHTRECLQRAAVQYAFSYYGGIRTFGEWDDHDVRRIPLESYLTPGSFRAIVTLPRFFARPS
jgi:peptidoglycan/xylan/chitin deacetylase (PgdA/CDA1 family)